MILTGTGLLGLFQVLYPRTVQVATIGRGRPRPRSGACSRSRAIQSPPMPGSAAAAAIRHLPAAAAAGRAVSGSQLLLCYPWYTTGILCLDEHTTVEDLGRDKVQTEATSCPWLRMRLRQHPAGVLRDCSEANTPSNGSI